MPTTTPASSIKAHYPAGLLQSSIMKEVIEKKLEAYRSEQSKLLATAKSHEELAQRARADAIAYGGAIQACEQLLAEILAATPVNARAEPPAPEPAPAG